MSYLLAVERIKIYLEYINHFRTQDKTGFNKRKYLFKITSNPAVGILNNFEKTSIWEKGSKPYKAPQIFKNIECALVMAKCKAVGPEDFIIYEPIGKGFGSEVHAFKPYQFFTIEKGAFDFKTSFKEGELDFEINYTIPENFRDFISEEITSTKKKFILEKKNDSYPENLNFYSSLQKYI